MKKFVVVVAVIFAGLIVYPRTHLRMSTAAAPTFNKEVVRIFQNNCQVCHHPGDIAPFSLMTYEDAAAWAPRIKAVTQSRYMPPWKPTDGCGNFQDVRRLSESDIATIAQWVDADAPEGDPADMPAPLEFDGGWSLGQPDAVLEMDTDYMPNPQSEDIYRCFTVPTNFTEDRWISAVDIQPGNRAIVHHVILFIEDGDESVQLDAQDPGPGYTCFGGPEAEVVGDMGAWAPGVRPQFLPEGVGWRIPAGARVIMQVHYRPNGNPEVDHTRLGLYFARGPVRKQLYSIYIANTDFTIPPGNSRYRVTTRFRVPSSLDVHVINVAPHMHLLGREMQVSLRLPNGQTQCLVNIDDWDFNWQAFYAFHEPVAVPRNSLVNVTAYFDNSADNPNNPNSPPRPVSWGEKTTDEMCLAIVSFTVDQQQLGPDGAPLTKMDPNAEQFLKAIQDGQRICRMN